MNARVRQQVVEALDAAPNGGDVQLAELPRAAAVRAAPQQRDPDRVTNVDRAILIVATLSSCLLAVWVLVTTIRFGWSWGWVVR